MKKLLTLFALASCFTLNAQIVQSDFPVVGDSTYYSKGDTTGFSPGAAGSSVTWNYSSMTRSGSNVTARYKTPGQVTGGVNFATADVAYTDSDGGYRFYDVLTDSVHIPGERSRLNTLITYSNPPTILLFPFAFNATLTDSFYGTYPDGFISTLDRKGQVTTIFDGTGTLTTPYATYSNARRVHRTFSSFDSSLTGAANSVITIDEYEWFESSGNRVPVMRYIRENIVINGGAPTITRQIWFKDDPANGRLDPSISLGLSVYPNPSTGSMFCTFSLKQAADAEARFTDLSGREVLHVSMGHLGAGEHTLPIHTDLQGVYLLEIKAGESKQSQRVILR